MSENPDDIQPEVQDTAYPEIEYVVREVPRKRPLIQRLGCGIALVIWFAFLLLPLLLFVLAIQGDITILHGDDIPDRQTHPRFQIYVQMEPEVQGFQFTTSSIKEIDSQNTCIEVNVRYFLWEGQGDPATYCDCYSRETTEDDWSYEETVLNACRIE